MLKLLRLHNYARVHAYQQFFALFILLSADALTIQVCGLLIAYFFSSMAGYVHNALCDRYTDAPARNAITANDISLGFAWGIFIFLLLSSSAIVFALNPLFLVPHLFYCALWFLYNQGIFGYRFKESVLGPLTASLLLVSLYPLLVLLILDKPVSLIWWALAIYSFAAEIGHTLRDYQIDKEANIMTYGIRMGLQRSQHHSFILLFISTALLLAGSVIIYGFLATTVSFCLALLLLYINKLLFNWKIDFDYNWFRRASATHLSIAGVGGAITLSAYSSISAIFWLLLLAFFYRLKTI